MNLPIDLKQAPAWMNRTGSDRDVVVSSRLRFARNIAGVSFPRKAETDVKGRILDRVTEALDEWDLDGTFHFVAIEDLEDLEKEVIQERRLGSPELTGEPMGGLVFDGDESRGLLINEEDHFRIQALQSGYALPEVREDAEELESALDREFGFASDDEWGYLTACPTNLGTGMRGSVLLHVPGLILRDEISRVLKAVANLGLTVRGYYGEGSESQGFYLQLSNQVTLGRSVENLLESLSRVTERIIDKERDARRKLFDGNSVDVEDQVYRSFGVLNQARSVGASEALKCLSLVRLGADAGFFDRIGLAEIDRLTMTVQPAHLNLSIGERLSSKDRDAYRARVLRKRFNADETPNSGSSEPIETERSDD